MEKRRTWLLAGAVASVLVLIFSLAVLAQTKGGGQILVVEGARDRASQGVEYAPGEILVRFKEGFQATAADAKAFADFATARGIKAVVTPEVLADPEAFSRRVGAQVLKSMRFRGSEKFPEGLAIHHVRVPLGMSVEEAIELYKSNPAVMYAEPNIKVYREDFGQAVPVRPENMSYYYAPNDALFGRMWALDNWGQEFRSGITGTLDADIDAVDAWGFIVQELGLNPGDLPEVIVADIDTGIDITHPDLAANIWVNEDEIPDNGIDDDGNGYIDDVNGWDFYNDDNTVYDPYDEDDHGTHTAGTVAAVAENGEGVVGVAWNVKIMALKFLGPDGGYTDDAIEAFMYAAANGANLTTNSWGYSGPPEQAMQDAIEACGLLSIFAAGNAGQDNDATYPGYSHYPSSLPCENIISVAASDWNDQLASFSCYGETTVDVVAPGVYILSTYPQDMVLPGYLPYAWMSGTSMATPHVAGAAAVLMAIYPGKPAYPGGAPMDPGAPDDGSALTIKDLIMSFSDRKPQFEGKVASGGRLNLFNAITYQLSPVITDVSASQTLGYAPVTVTLSASAHDPDGQISLVAWLIPAIDFTAYSETVSVTFDTPGTYEAFFITADDQDNEAVAKVTITVIEDEDTVLIINDDDGAPGDQMIASALEIAGLDYAILTPPLTGVPTDISNVVIWNLGGAWDGTLTDEDIAWLEAYLDNSGRLLIAGMDLIWDLGGHPFVQNYLHVAEFSEDIGISTAYGVAGEFTEGMEMDLDYSVFGGVDYSDIIVPDEYGRAIFTDENGYPYAICSAKDGYKVIFLAFPVEAMPMGGEVAAQSTTAYLEDFVLEALEILTPTPPAALFSYVENEPNTVQFTDLSTDAAGDIVSWEWNFGDGSTSTEQSPVHQYAANGNYQVTLTVTDADGATDTVEQTVVVRNAAPTADFSFTEVEPLKVQFADGSSDVDGMLMAWSWDFGDGTPVSNERNPVHAYAEGGTYNVTLTVTDNDDAVTTITKTITLNRLPIVHLIAPAEGDVWFGTREIVWTAEDPDGDDVTIDIFYSDDGGVTWFALATGEPNDGVFTWDTTKVAKGGDAYQVLVKATDDHGGTGTATSGLFTVVVLRDMVMAVPNPASDHVIFYYQLDEDATLYVYDIAGRLVHAADLAATSSSEPGAMGARNGGYAPAEGVYVWNLTNVNGEPLANGLYLYLVVTDSGEKSGVKRLVISR